MCEEGTQLFGVTRLAETARNSRKKTLMQHRVLLRLVGYSIPAILKGYFYYR